MKPQTAKRAFNRRAFFVGLILLSLIHVVLGVIMMHMSKTELREQIEVRIKNASALICRQFTHSPVFRIGGDEFVVLLENDDFNSRETLLSAFNKQIEENLRNGAVVVSTGMDIFIPEQDSSFSEVFARADQKMYARKRWLKSL